MNPASCSWYAHLWSRGGWYGLCISAHSVRTTVSDPKRERRPADIRGGRRIRLDGRRARYTCTLSNRSQPRVDLRRDGRLASQEDCCKPWTNTPPGKCLTTSL